MTRQSKQTFEQILLAVASQNAQVLERKADIAALLAVTYPQCEGTLRAIESAAIEQMLRILVHMPSTRDTWATVCDGGDGGRRLKKCQIRAARAIYIYVG